MSREVRARTLTDDWDDFCGRGFLRLPNAMLRWDMDLDPHAKLMLLTLMSWANPGDPTKRIRRKGREIRISHLIEWTGFVRNTVTRCLETLEKAGYITVSREEGANNEYYLNVVEIINACREQHDW